MERLHYSLPIGSLFESEARPKGHFFSLFLHRPRNLNFKRLSTLAKCCVFIGISDFRPGFSKRLQHSETRALIFSIENLAQSKSQ